jgi:hypothetical protein
MRETAKSIRAKRMPLSPVANVSGDPSWSPASVANKTHPPATSTAISPKPSQTASICGATSRAGTFSRSQYGFIHSIDQAFALAIRKTEVADDERNPNNLAAQPASAATVLVSFPL